MSEAGPQYNSFIQTFEFGHDSSKPGRVLSSAKIGDIFMSRLVMEPGVTTGNYYHKVNRLMFYVEYGKVIVACEHIRSKERKQMIMEPGQKILHVPEDVALATRNIGRTEAVIIFFSNFPIRDPDDCYDYEVLKK